MEMRFFATTLENLSAFAESLSPTALPLNTGCCPCESGVTATGMFHRYNPRHADVLVVAGALSIKAAPVVRRIYDQMPSPKYVLGVGTCAKTGGLFGDSYAVVGKLSDILPVDVFVRGCPPSAADFSAAVAELKKKIGKDGR